MGFKSMREELIVTKAGLGHLLEEKKTVEPQYNCRCQGILFHTFYFNWGLAPICKESENCIQCNRWREAIPCRSGMYNILFEAQAKEKKLPKMCDKMSASNRSYYEQPASWYCLFAGLSKVAGCWRKSLPTWLVSTGYSAWHFFTNGIF